MLGYLSIYFWTSVRLAKILIQQSAISNKLYINYVDEQNTDVGNRSAERSRVGGGHNLCRPHKFVSHNP